jgi:hypothetical protein
VSDHPSDFIDLVSFDDELELFSGRQQPET